MTTKPYIPQPDSLADRVCRFLRANPREELDVPDMVAKFGVVQRAIDPGLEGPIRHGLVVKFADSTGTRIWKAGPKLAEMEDIIPTTRQIGAPPAPPTTAAKSVFDAAAQARKAARPPRGDRPPKKHLPMIDIAAVTVRQGVPMPAHPRDTVGGKYDALFAKLEKVGYSTEVDAQYMGALKSAAKKYAKTVGALFTVRKTEEGRCGIWRTK